MGSGSAEVTNDLKILLPTVTIEHCASTDRPSIYNDPILGFSVYYPTKSALNCSYFLTYY
jgi:hypothetical protein